MDNRKNACPYRESNPVRLARSLPLCWLSYQKLWTVPLNWSGSVPRNPRLLINQERLAISVDAVGIVIIPLNSELYIRRCGYLRASFQLKNTENTNILVIHFREFRAVHTSHPRQLRHSPQVPTPPRSCTDFSPRSTFPRTLLPQIKVKVIIEMYTGV